MSWRRRTFVCVLIVIACAVTFGIRPNRLAASTAPQAKGPVILTLREQAAVYNVWLKTRLDRILPELMRQEGFDMWLVICRENTKAVT